MIHFFFKWNLFCRAKQVANSDRFDERNKLPTPTDLYARSTRSNDAVVMHRGARPTKQNNHKINQPSHRFYKVMASYTCTPGNKRQTIPYVHRPLKRHCCLHDACAASFERSDNLRRHVRSAHSNMRHHCTYSSCVATFSDQSSLRRHYVKTHVADLAIDVHACKQPACMAKFSDASSLKRHVVSMHHSVHQLSFTCSVEGCSSTFSRLDHKHRHETLHGGARPFVCTVDSCTMKFALRHHLSRHMRTVHSPEMHKVPRFKSREEQVASALDAAGIRYDREVHVGFCGCELGSGSHFARIDFVLYGASGVVLLEVTP